ncbi:6-carboxytetrahydropterin synthase [Nonomuraea turkmeniaca]|uniref:6-carboxy-5,6,7,8-tetrahydropterin synthase n=1 Tax=Nonomuraea turkmeniaca TaxID=103838 RepID=A0A5S4F289_9ACTN|nr:6-carboxytetrahydropterin synthase [Nonomuraea turkmeniaca]TMR10094.1 6-carboxytetrahydropterin synthase [Nonomuraea turkmeniaca]
MPVRGERTTRVFTTVFTRQFCASHQVPYLPGELAQLHGHTWRVSLTVAGPSLDAHGLLVDEAAFAASMGGFISTRLDHSTMVGAGDPFTPILDAHGKKLFVFGSDYDGAAWPTSQALALMLAHHGHGWLAAASDRKDVLLASVTVHTTEDVTATWHNPTLLPALTFTR